MEYRRLCNVAVSHEILKQLPQIVGIGESVPWNWNRPFVAKTVSINVEMRGRHLLVVRIAVWRTAKIEPHENDYVTSPFLVFAFFQVNFPTADIQPKMLFFIHGDKWNTNITTQSRVIKGIVVLSHLLQGNQNVGFSLG